MSHFEHVTVMLQEAVDFLSPRPGGTYVDVTAGGGGHSEAILDSSGPSGFLLAMDRDLKAVAATRARLARFGERAKVVHAPFGELISVLQAEGLGRVDGVIADLGVSSPQVDDPERGFSFRSAGPLDMRMDPTRGETAAELVARLDVTELADVIYEYGEERKSRRIARSIKMAVADGRLETTSDLRAAVVRAVGPKRGRIDPSTRTFQALRIAVNRELDELDVLLDTIPTVLKPEGTTSIISFHSLEDRKVKWAFRGDSRLTPLTKKPVTASETEASANSRSRSAKLRAARRNHDEGDS